jgi:amphi-Trp domain-containing protein
MTSQNNEFKHESLQDSQTIVKYINALAEGFSSGRLALGNNGNPIVLEPTGMLKLDLKAKRKDGRMKLSVKISWKEEDEEKKQIDSKPLVIESQKAE